MRTWNGFATLVWLTVCVCVCGATSHGQMPASQGAASAPAVNLFRVDTQLFRAGEPADCGYVVQRGSFRVSFADGTQPDITAGAGSLIGELALIVPMQRPATAIALEFASAIRITRTLFQRVLESEPDGARRLRDAFASRTSQAASDLVLVGARLIG